MTLALMAAYTGARTYGASLLPSLFINTGGAIATSSIANSPNAAGSILGAALGTSLGYPFGVAVQSGLNSSLNHWSRPLWQDMGYTIQRWVRPSPVPGALGTVGSSTVQEVGNAAVNSQNIIANRSLSEGSRK